MIVSLGSIVALVGLVGTVVLTLGRALWLIAEVKKKVDELEKELAMHIQSTSLHRNPDSEARWTRLESKLDRLEEQNAKILEAMARNQPPRETYGPRTRG